MPEPLTIFTTVVSILSFVRNSTETFYKDAQDWKNYPQYYKALFIKLVGLKKSFEAWQNRWMIWTGDTELFKLFWGTGCDDVIEQLQGISKEVKRLSETLKHCDIMQGHRAKQYAKRAMNILFRKLRLVNEQISTLKGMLEELNATADREFRPRPPDDGKLEMSEIQRLGYENLLVRLAWNTFEASNELHGSCDRARSEVEMHMELDFFGPDIKSLDRLLPKLEEPTLQKPTARPPVVSPTMLVSLAKSVVEPPEELIAGIRSGGEHPMSAAGPAIRYTFLSKDLKNPQLWVRIRATSAKLDQADEDKFRKECKKTISEAQRAIAGRVNESGRCGLEFCPNGTLAIAREELGNIKGPIPDPVSLRNILPTTTDDTEFAQILRMRRAFQLAEFGMLFLKTSWIHSICVCNISQVKITSNQRCSREQLYRYVLKLPPLCHRPLPDDVNGGSRPDSTSTCWCVQKAPSEKSIFTKLQDYPLFYLGLLLTEVALDVVILNVSLTKGDSVKAKFLKLLYKASDTEEEARVERTFDSLQPDLGKDYYNATLKCLESTWTTDNVQQNDLDMYFRKILYPIYMKYAELVKAYNK